MKTIEVSVVETYVNGVLHSLDLAGYHLGENNQRSTQIEIENAKVELRALSQDLKSPQENQTKEEDMSKWEYATLTHRTDTKAGAIETKTEEWLYFHAYNPSKKDINYKPHQRDEIIEWLGNNGWELVTVTEIRAELTTSLWRNTIRYYFKKAKELGY